MKEKVLRGPPVSHVFAEARGRVHLSCISGGMRGAEPHIIPATKEPICRTGAGRAAYFAQLRVMRGGGRGASGEERSAGAASGAAVEGAPLGKAATATGTTPHYARCAMSAKHDA